MKLYLASTSPRRKKILREMGLKFTTLVPKYAERAPRRARLTAGRLVRFHALAKARSAAGLVKEGVILGADTLVFSAGRPVGKPRSLRHAERMLGKIQGRWHTVRTGVALLIVKEGTVVRTRAWSETSRVLIAPLSKAEVRAYFRRVNPLDKAGAYAIQSKHNVVARVKGSFSNVAGLPAESLRRALRALPA